MAARWRLLKSEPPPDPASPSELDEITKVAPPLKIRVPKDDEVDRLADEGLREVTMGPHMELLNVPVSASGLLILTYFPECQSTDNWQRSSVNMRLSKQSIMERLEYLVDLWIKERQELGLKQQQSEERVRLDTYIDYLKVYDLKKEGKNYREIGKILWSGLDGDTEQKAKKYYIKAKHLVLNPPLI